MNEQSDIHSLKNMVLLVLIIMLNVIFFPSLSK